MPRPKKKNNPVKEQVPAKHEMVEAVQNAFSELAVKSLNEFPEYAGASEHARSALVSILETRRNELAESAPESKHITDPMFKSLRAMLKHFDELDAIVKGFAIQVNQNTTMNPNAAAASLDEMIAAITAILNIELEAKASQARIHLSSIVQQYAGASRLKPITLAFDLDYHLAEAFKSLLTAVRSLRERKFGRTDGYGQEDLFSHLVALGQANVELLARLGAPELLAAPLGLAGIQRIKMQGTGAK